jgi:hypothetical protein
MRHFFGKRIGYRSFSTIFRSWIPVKTAESKARGWGWRFPKTVFFDFGKYDRVCQAVSPDTKLIALLRNPMEEQGLPQHVKIVHTPITCLLAARLLDERLYAQPSGLPEADGTTLHL